MTDLERAYEKLNAEVNRPVMGEDILIVAMSRAEAQALRYAALRVIRLGELVKVSNLVEEFGAKCDGVTDISDALRAAGIDPKELLAALRLPDLMSAERAE